MGMLIDGVWQKGTAGAAGEDGQFHREEASFRRWLTADGGNAPTGEPAVQAEPARFRLYVSLACPWAHRTLIVRALKGLETLIPLSVVNWHMGDNGWSFAPGPLVTPDPERNATYLHELYQAAKPGMTGKVTVPVLWDSERGEIVSNESADIIRMFNEAYDALGARPGDFYPAELRGEIDQVNDKVYDAVNNGVYKAGFAATQQAYEEAIGPLFETLDELDALLQTQDWLVGGVMTEADIRLFTTLIRFDSVYYVHFKCNVKRIADYPGLHAFVQRMMDIEAVASTVNFQHIKHHYYESHAHLNPSGIVPAGPAAPY
ncbi:glutathione S-transferase family protein [Stenotrophomonas sp. 169]|uniref:glutathione S-transferase family protein n=1 Tax=Stenotrophomonas sp. 169 TaxID=2770322 RepID=UPI001662794C|nr:glutathione S-transferase family protein [Stenotrophomonas sp. 169]QNR97129.1 glutathione S-transferase family protein [Stenotrophomonas sp. 169]